MKTIISKLMALLILINAIIPTTAFANGENVIYNCGYEVEFANGIYEYNGKIYIHIEDLAELYLRIDADSNTIYNHRTGTDLVVYPGSSIVEVNGISMLYSNSAVILDGGVYVALDLIAMLFSQLYEVNGNQINLWITKYYAYDFARGVVSLPEGEVADEGGISVDVFVTEAYSTSTGGGGSSSPIYSTTKSYISNVGLDGVEKPSYDNLIDNYSSPDSYVKLVEKTITIPEGYNSAEFYLYQVDGDFYGSKIGYAFEYNGYTCCETINFKKTIESYDFTINTQMTYINGTVAIPEMTEDDVKFTVVAEGEYGYTYEGIISAGETSTTYSMLVDANDYYSMLVFFEDGKYKRIYSPEDITVENESVFDIDFETEYSTKYDVTLELPQGCELEQDVEAKVYIQSVASPYYYLDMQTIIIPAGENSVNVILHDDMEAKNLICYYVLTDDCNGLFDFGHYSSGGTSFDVSNAEYINSYNNTIVIELLKSKEITASISLPNDETAETDIYVDIEPAITTSPVIDDSSVEVVDTIGTEETGEDITTIEFEQSTIINTELNSGETILLLSSEATSSGVTGGGGGGSSTGGVTVSPVDAEPTIAEGETTGEVKISIPYEEGYGYRLTIRVSDDAENYYGKIYYNTSKTTTLIDNASTVSITDDIIFVELIKQYTISGCVNAVGYTDGHNRIYAISQKDKSIRNDVYGADFSIYTDIYGNENYELFVPDEFDDYIFKLYSFNDGDSIYYAEPKSIENIDESMLLSINNDESNINFEYDGFKPDLPVRVSVENTGDIWEISMNIIGDFDVENVINYIALYDETGKMLSMYQSPEALSVLTSGTTKTGIEVPTDEIENASTVKLFTWSDNLKPVSDVVYIKKTNSNEEISHKSFALLWAQNNDNVIYRKGESFEMDVDCVILNDEIYLPLRAGTECFEWYISWEDTTKTVTIEGDNHIAEFTVNENEAIIDGAMISINNPILIVNQRAMVPLGEIATLFGYIATKDSEAGTLAVYDKLSYLASRAIDCGLVSSKFNGCGADDNITRSQLASLVTRLYENKKGEIIISQENPYSDTDDIDILKTYEIGIMSGYEDGTFNPERCLTNAEMITILQRTLKSIGITIPTDFSETSEFDNLPKDGSHWATDITYSMKELGVLKSVFDNTIELDASANIRNTFGVCSNCYQITN